MDARLSPDRAEQIRRLFIDILDLPADECSDFLEEACSSDPSLRSDLTSFVADGSVEAFVDGADSEVIEPLLRELERRPIPKDDFVGRTVSRYTILDRLGGGGMGVVYRARETRLDRIVALKFLPPEMTRDRDAKARFIHEAKAASALDHSNICTIYEIDEADDGRLFIAMACLRQ